MKRLAVLFLLSIAAAWPAGNPDPQEFAARVVAFHEHWNLFLRSYLGCPRNATDVEQCNPKMGTIDYREFNAAAKEGRLLFARPE